MANERDKDFNAMLHKPTDMPKIQIVTDERTLRTYGGARMLLAPPLAYDELMKTVPFGKVVTVGALRACLAQRYHADFTDPMTAGIFVTIAAWASEQRAEGQTPYWRTLKANGELNPKYPGGIAAQRAKLEAEGHVIVEKGRKNLRYYVEGYEKSLFPLE